MMCLVVHHVLDLESDIENTIRGGAASGLPFRWRQSLEWRGKPLPVSKEGGNCLMAEMRSNERVELGVVFRRFGHFAGRWSERQPLRGKRVIPNADGDSGISEDVSRSTLGSLSASGIGCQCGDVSARGWVQDVTYMLAGSG
jgi:hypothetical protein